MSPTRPNPEQLNRGPRPSLHSGAHFLWNKAIRFSSWIDRFSGWIALSTLFVIMLFAFVVFPYESAMLPAEVKQAGCPDFAFLYSADDLYSMAQEHGELGRRSYIRFHLTDDILWPWAVALFYCAALSWGARKIFPPGSPWRQLNLAPIPAVLFDHFENLFVSLVMLRFPDRLPLVSALASASTFSKWLFTGIGLATLAGVLATAVWRRLSGDRRA